jgi:hypothetical protein
LIGISSEQSAYDGMLSILQRPDVSALALQRVQNGHTWRAIAMPNIFHDLLMEIYSE